MTPSIPLRLSRTVRVDPFPTAGARARAQRHRIQPWHRATWQAASLLLSYPDGELRGQLPLLRSVAAALPAGPSASLGRFLDHLDTTPDRDLAEHYVEVFDHRRRCCLYLTYFAHGDTRKRGMALLRFKTAYRAAGLDPTEGELPDHLAVVLEFAATGNAEAGRGLLLDHRAGLEVLRLALQDAESPYADVVRAVCATLPPLEGPEVEAVQRLAAEGPPAEEVGLDPYGPGSLGPDPQGSSSLTPGAAPLPAGAIRRAEGTLR